MQIPRILWIVFILTISVTSLSFPGNYQVFERDGCFKTYRNGVIYDTCTGFEWFPGPDRAMSWEEARDWVERLDGERWRMPSEEELDNPAPDRRWRQEHRAGFRQFRLLDMGRVHQGCRFQMVVQVQLWRRRMERASASRGRAGAGGSQSIMMVYSSKSGRCPGVIHLLGLPGYWDSLVILATLKRDVAELQK
jgi:hypothetical protein